MEANAYREQENAKLQLSYLHKLAQWNSFAFSAPKKMPRLKDEFPELFAGKKTPIEKKPVKWEAEKARFALFAAAHNARFKQKEDTAVCPKKD